ncbi:hypothetical protein [Haladaptatus sp. DYSN1]|uniref:hypothetical protein n=1 Tax=unclassified Haladaptatus TaxID=2622732 RepID=UPI002406376F|nr:hypothetical protein [Haladaptatus sp. DYSN1]
MRHFVAAVAVSFLLVTAGCSGILGGSDLSADISATPVAVPSDPTWPPGVNETSVSNVTALMTGHRDALSNQAAVIHIERTTTQLCEGQAAPHGDADTCENATIIRDGFSEGKYSANHSHHSARGYTFANSTHMERARTSHYRTYGEGEQLYINQTHNGNSSYQVVYDQYDSSADPDEPSLPQMLRQDRVAEILEQMEVVDVTVIQESPQKRYRITARGFEDSREILERYDANDIKSSQLSMVVTETGAILSSEYSYTLVHDEGPRQYEYAATLEYPDTLSPVKPDWISTMNGVDMPPGLNTSGISNSSALTTAHESALANQSATIHYSSGREGAQSVVVGPNADQFRLVTRSPGGVREIASNGSATYAFNGSEGYQVQQVDNPEQARSNLTHGEFVSRVLHTAEEAAALRVRGENVRTESPVYYLSGTIEGNETSLEPAINGSVEEIRFRAEVTSNGLVRHAYLYYTVAEDGERDRYRESVWFGNVGNTTVSEPPWWGEGTWLVGKNATGQRELVDSHEASLENRSLTIYATSQTESQTDSGQFLFESSTRREGRIAANGSHYRVDIQRYNQSANGTTRDRVVAWANGSARFERTNVDRDSYEYTLVRDEQGNVADPAALLQVERIDGDDIELLLSTIEVDSISAHNRGTSGDTLTVDYRLSGHNVTDRAAFEAWTGHENVSALSMEMTVRDGVVREYRLDYDTTENGTTDRISREVRMHNIGRTEVPFPEWVETARERTNKST